MMAFSTNAVVIPAGPFATTPPTLAPSPLAEGWGEGMTLLPAVLVRRHHLARLVGRGREHGDMPGLAPLVEVVAGDSVVLDRQHARLGPLAVLAEFHLADIGAEFGLVHVFGELGLVEASHRTDRLLEHFHHRVGEGRQVEAEEVDAFLRRARLVLDE